MPWSTPFPDPIELPDGRLLKTFRQAAAYIQRLPRVAQRRPEWQLATKLLIEAAEDRGIKMMAEIAVRKALDLPAPPRERKRAKKYRIIR